MAQRTSTEPTGEWIAAVLGSAELGKMQGHPEVAGSQDVEMLLWMLPEGPVLNATAIEAGSAEGHIVEDFEQTTRSPVYGPPHVPARVRVASESLAAVLRPALEPRTQVVCAPTPEVNEVAAVLAAHFGDGMTLPDSYLAPDVSPGTVAGFFHACARLFRAKPWDHVPDDTSLLAVSIPELDVQDAVLSVVGQTGESHGLILFESLDDFEDFLDAAEVMEAGGPDVALPPHLGLHYEPGAELSPELRQEVAAHGWEVADAEAYPAALRFEADGHVHLADTDDLRLLEGLALALSELCSDVQGLQALQQAWRQGTPLVRASRIETGGGHLRVTLSAPYQSVLPPDDQVHVAKLLEEARERAANADDLQAAPQQRQPTPSGGNGMGMPARKSVPPQKPGNSGRKSPSKPNGRKKA